MTTFSLHRGLAGAGPRRRIRGGMTRLQITYTIDVFIFTTLVAPGGIRAIAAVEVLWSASCRFLIMGRMRTSPEKDLPRTTSLSKPERVHKIQVTNHESSSCYSARLTAWYPRTNKTAFIIILTGMQRVPPWRTCVCSSNPLNVCQLGCMPRYRDTGRYRIQLTPGYS